MTSVKAAHLDPSAVAAKFMQAAEKEGFRREVFGEAGGVPLFALTKRTAGPCPRIYLSAGIHGDEPAPPQALVSLLESGEFDSRATWLLCPLLNPEGLSRGTRENAAGVDLNRDYRNPEAPESRAHVGWLRRQPLFDLSICVHEDWESTGFYLYELNPDTRRSLAPAIIEAASRACPIETSNLIDGREAKGGIIRPVVNPEEREKWPEAVYLIANHTRLSYTIESPSSLQMDVRVAALKAALSAAIAGFAGRRTARPGPNRRGA